MNLRGVCVVELERLIRVKDTDPHCRVTVLRLREGRERPETPSTDLVPGSV